jgi:hypothetical protein
MTIQMALQMLPPPDGSRNSILNYSTTVGVPIAIQPWDITSLQANGWTFYVGGQSSAIPQGPSIAIPGGCLAAFSVVPVNGYSGNCLRVQRASDSAVLDVGFRGVADWQSVESWASGSPITVVKWYDQSGNGNHLTPYTAYHPTFLGYSNFNGIRPVNFNTVGGNASNALTTPISLNANNFTIYQVLANRINNQANCWFSMHNTAVNSESIALYFTDATPLLTLGLTWPGGAQSVGFTPPTQLGYFSLSGNGIANSNGNSISFAAATSQVVGNFMLGGSIVSPYWYSGDVFFTAIYPANHTATQQAAINAAIFSPFPDNIIKNKQILYDGSSLVTSYHQTYGRDLPRQVGFGRTTLENSNGLFSQPALPDWVVFNMAQGGRALAVEAANGPAAYMQQLGAVPPGFTKNIAVIDAPSNDIGGATYTSTATAQTAMQTLFTGTTLPMIAALLADGFTGVVVPTIIPRNGFQAGSGNYYEDARSQYNSLVRAGATANGYVCSDRAALGPFSKINSWQNSAYYSGDGIHPADLGYSVIAACDRAAILSL